MPTLRDDEIETLATGGPRLDQLPRDGDDTDSNDADADDTDSTVPTRPMPTPTRTTPTRTARTPRRHAAAALARCLDPVDAETFFAEHWERRPLIVPRDEPGRFDDLLSERDVERLVCSTAIRYPGFRLVQRGPADRPRRLHERRLVAPAVHEHGRRPARARRVGGRARRSCSRRCTSAGIRSPSSAARSRRRSATASRRTRTTRRAARRGSRCTTTRTTS